MHSALRLAAARAAEYLDEIQDRRVGPSAEAVAGLERLGGPLPREPMGAEEVVRLLDEVGSPATMGIAGPRFFGFVIGGALPRPWRRTGWLQPGIRMPDCFWLLR